MNKHTNLNHFKSHQVTSQLYVSVEHLYRLLRACHSYQINVWLMTKIMYIGT